MVTRIKQEWEQNRASIVLDEETLPYQTGGSIVRVMDVGPGESPMRIEYDDPRTGPITRCVRFCGEYGAELEALVERAMARARGERGDGNVYLDREDVRGAFDAFVMTCSFWPLISTHRIVLVYAYVAERHGSERDYELWRSACVSGAYFTACLERLARPFLGPHPSSADERALRLAAETVLAAFYEMKREGTSARTISGPDLALLTDGFSAGAIEDALGGVL